jgi:hypothetical protein
MLAIIRAEHLQAPHNRHRAHNGKQYKDRNILNDAHVPYHLRISASYTLPTSRLHAE